MWEAVMGEAGELGSEGDSVAVSVLEREGRTATGRVYVRSLDKPTRTKRASMALLICWGLALVSVPIMFLHFFLVPLFGVLGPILFVMRMKQESTVLGAEVDCPACGKTNTLGKQAAGWPLLASCEFCSTRLTITPVAAASNPGPTDSAEGVS
jgi:hypothetical protein